MGLSSANLSDSSGPTVFVHGSSLIGDTVWMAALVHSLKQEHPGSNIHFGSDSAATAALVPDQNATWCGLRGPSLEAYLSNELKPDFRIELFGEGSGTVRKHPSGSLEIIPPEVRFYRSSIRDDFTSPHIEVTGREHIVDSLHAFTERTIPLALPSATNFLATEFSESVLHTALTVKNAPHPLVIGVGATSLVKTLSHKRWVELGNTLAKQGFTVFLVGAKEYETIIDSELRILQNKNDSLHSLVGQTHNDIALLTAIVSFGRMVIAGDTGIGHIAAAFGVPTVSVFPGYTNPDYAKPYGEHAYVVQTNASLDTLKIDLDDVLEMITDIYPRYYNRLPQR